MKKPVIVLALMLALPFGVTACGGGDDKSDEDQVREVIELVNSSDPALCNKVTDKWGKKVVRGDKGACEDQVKSSPKDTIDVKTVSVAGDKATVTVDVRGQPGRFFLVKDGDDWKLDDIKQAR